MPTKNEELTMIMTKFADCGWDLIDGPAEAWVSGSKSNADMMAIVVQANGECGNCGCEFDTLYKRAIELLSA